ncbi:MAG: DUF1573 domain-containing protein [Bacteroidales bacterium]|nr:DUF1573 domain-containing protein [Bacteroidales bacterium]
MKKISIILIALVTLAAISCKENKNTGGGEYGIDNPISADNVNEDIIPNDGMPIISFAETEYNFGTVIQGEKVSHKFMFTNKGDGNLVISSVKPSCGCTSPKWTREPIKPGEEGFIELTFDSSNKKGIQNKNVRVATNTIPNEHVLYIRCDVVTK